MYGHVTCMYLYIFISVQPICNRYIFPVAAIKHVFWWLITTFIEQTTICSSGMPAENSADFSPKMFVPERVVVSVLFHLLPYLGGDDLIFNLTFSNVAKDTPQRNCWLWSIIPTFCSWKELIYLGDFLLSRNRSPTRRSWQNFFLLFTDRYDQFEANAKTRM